MISATAFSKLMSATGPYEGRPRLAVAVSGGGDSMSLALLAKDWAEEAGGMATALIVDHGLRQGSGREAETVSAWLNAVGMEARVLTWRGDKPDTGIQAAARQARYALMRDWCLANGVLHLVVGHTMEDQAETLLMRLEKGSGPDGLAAMGAVTETAECRIERPLLGTRRGDLREFLRARGQAWIEDPSNEDSRFERVRWRRMIEERDLSVEGLAATAHRYGVARRALEWAAARQAGLSVRLHAAGFAFVEADTFTALPEEIAARILSRLLAAIGGRTYAPNRSSVERLVASMGYGEGIGTTLARCRIRRQGAGYLVCRELRGLPTEEPVTKRAKVRWDGRFLLDVAPGAGGADIVLRPLGRRDGERILETLPEFANLGMPRYSLWPLPVLADGLGIRQVPFIGYRREGDDGPPFSARFRPPQSLSGPGFFVA